MQKALTSLDTLVTFAFLVFLGTSRIAGKFSDLFQQLLQLWNRASSQEFPKTLTNLLV
jgi:Fe2+ transport system protein B